MVSETPRNQIDETSAPCPMPAAAEGGEKPRFTPGPWEWHTSNSWRRLKHDTRGLSMNVLEPFVAIDGHPDLTVSQADMALIQAAPALYEALAVITHLWAGHAEQCASVQGRRCDCDWPKVKTKCDHVSGGIHIATPAKRRALRKNAA